MVTLSFLTYVEFKNIFEGTLGGTIVHFSVIVSAIAHTIEAVYVCYQGYVTLGISGLDLFLWVVMVLLSGLSITKKFAVLLSSTSDEAADADADKGTAPNKKKD